MRRIEGPGIDVLVLVGFGAPWTIRDATNPDDQGVAHDSFVAGLHETAVITEHTGQSEGIQISLTPLGAYALFRTSMAELAGRTCALDDVLSDDSFLSIEALESAVSAQRRFALLDDALARRVDGAREPTPEVLWAWERVLATRGTVRVGELTAQLGWSRRRLGRRFQEEVGLGPKAFARMVRFDCAACAIGTSELARVAIDCGYYDQSHLTSDVKRVTGMTPAAYARRRTNFQDVPPRAA